MLPLLLLFISPDCPVKVTNKYVYKLTCQFPQRQHWEFYGILFHQKVNLEIFDIFTILSIKLKLFLLNILWPMKEIFYMVQSNDFINFFSFAFLHWLFMVFCEDIHILGGLVYDLGFLVKVGHSIDGMLPSLEAKLSQMFNIPVLQRKFFARALYQMDVNYNDSLVYVCWEGHCGLLCSNMFNCIDYFNSKQYAFLE